MIGFKMGFRMRDIVQGINGSVIAVSADTEYDARVVIKSLIAQGFTHLWTQRRMHCSRCDGKGEVWEAVKLKPME